MKRDPHNRRSTGLYLVVVFCLCISIAVGAEPGFDATHRERTESLRHESLELKIALPKPSFFLGELIPVTFQFEDTKNTGKYQAWIGTYDRSGRIQDLGFVIDGPAGSHCDPLTAYFGGGPFIVGGIGNHAELGRHEQVFHLNEWIRFDRPGKYRLYATSSRVSWTSDNVSHGVELVSPVISVEIRTPTAEELDSTFRDAVAASPAASRDRYDPAVREALSRLRYLDTEASRRHLRGLLGGVEGAASLAMFGLIGTRETEAAIALLEEGIANPAVTVTPSYFDALASLRRSRLKDKGGEQPPPNSPAGAKASRSVAWLTTDHYGDRADWKKLVDAFDRKTDRARAVCASSLFSLIQNERRQDQQETEAKAKGFTTLLKADRERLDHTTVLPKVRVPLAHAFHELTHGEQERLLEASWDLIRCPEFLPALRKIVDRPADQPDASFRNGLQSWAVLRLAELDPAAGKALLLKDVRRRQPRYSLEVLCSLPRDDLKKELPLLASHFSAKEGVDTDKIAGMIAHIGDDSIYDAVKRHYVKSEGLWVCITQRHCLDYFIKVRRSEGLDLAFRAMTFRGKEHTHCYSDVAGEVLARSYGPDVESRLVAALRAESEPEVMTDLTRVLLKHGTEAVIDPLLDVVERLSPKAIREDYSYNTEAGARHHTVEGLMRATAERAERSDGARWKLTPRQRERLKSSLASEQERKAFQGFFKAD